MNKTEVVTIEKLPENVDELRNMLDEYITSPFSMAALTIAVCCNWEKDVSQTIDMLNFIRGPKPLSQLDIQFFHDRLDGKSYVVKSYVKGATLENNYVLPNSFFQIEVSDNPYSYQNENYATLYLKSSGADSLRPITLRKKPSTKEWFLWEYTFLSDVRIPKSKDEWA